MLQLYNYHTQQWDTLYETPNVKAARAYLPVDSLYDLYLTSVRFSDPEVAWEYILDFLAQFNGFVTHGYLDFIADREALRLIHNYQEKWN